ncbi:MAG: hypothetical protein INF04_12800 [Phenylobacterium sp.]|nr:hypothetical protein [Phenylobacterium sp.]
MIPFSRIAVASAVVFGSVSIASAASAAMGGDFLISNTASKPVDLVADSHPSRYSKKFPTTISALGSGAGRARATNTDRVFSGTVIYLENISKFGCSFTTVITYNSRTMKYTFSFSSAKQGGSLSTATCSITASRNVNTGEFTAYPVIGGF